MKELSIEEKAKRYDEAIEKMQSMMKSWETLSYNGKTFLQDIKYIFPELKDSDDEKVRKEILEFFSQFENGELRGVDISSWIAWLEKQGEKGINGKNREIPFSEQKPNPCGNCGIATNNCQNFPCVIRDGEQKSTDKVEPKFRIGDIIKDTEDGEVFTIRTITKDKYIYTDDSFDWIKDQDEYELVEQKPIDEEMKELLHTEYEKGRADAIEEMQNPAWSEEDEKYWSIVIAEFSKCAGKSVSKDEWMRCNDWLNSLKDRIQPQHKQEWSERDELMLGKCINAVSGYYSPEDKQSMKDWLYFLKQRHTWKPSDEQMKALWVTFMGGEEQAALASLYNDLKKLK